MIELASKLKERNLVTLCACVQLLMFFKYYFADNFKMDKWCGVPQSWRPLPINDLEDQTTLMAPTPLAHFIMPNCDLRCFPPWLFVVFSMQTPQCIQSRVSWVDQVAILFFLFAFLLVNFSFGILVIEAWELLVVACTKAKGKTKAMWHRSIENCWMGEHRKQWWKRN